MATCQDIDGAISSLKASQDLAFAQLRAEIAQVKADQQACCNQTQIALSLAQAAQAAIISIQGTLATLGNQLAALIATVATTISLFSRVDALENGQNQLNQGLSNVLGQITALKSYVDGQLAAVSNEIRAVEVRVRNFITEQVVILNDRINYLTALILACCKRIDDFTNPNNPNSPMNQCCTDLGNKIDNLTNAVNNIVNNQGSNTQIVEQGLNNVVQQLSGILGRLNFLAEAFNTLASLVRNLSDLIKILFGDGSKPFSTKIEAKSCSGHTWSADVSDVTIGGTVLAAVGAAVGVLNRVYLEDCNYNKTSSQSTDLNIVDCFGQTQDTVTIGDDPNSFVTKGLFIALQKQIAMSTGYCTNYSSQLPTYDCATGKLSNKFSGGGFGLSGISSAIEALAKQNSYYFQCINDLSTGNMSITACGQTYTNPYQGLGVQSTITGALQAQNKVIGRVLNDICQNLNPSLSGSYSQTICGSKLSANYSGQGLNGVVSAIRAYESINYQAFNLICQKLDIQLADNLSFDICGNPVTAQYSGKGFQGIIQAMDAYSSIHEQAAGIICDKIADMDCLPYELEPDSKYAERTLSSQIFIRFVDKRVVTDPTNFKKKTAYKCRLVIPNPRTGLTCTDLAPITWTKGRFFGRINFDIKNINTHNYFSTELEAQNVLAIAGALSTNAVTTVPARVTSGTNPLYPEPSVIGITVIPYYAVITTLVNGKVTATENLCCL